MPKDHAGPGTLIVPGRPRAKVTLNIVADEKSGWHIVHGVVRGDPEDLLAAYENNQRAILVHDATSFVMKLTIADRPADGLANVTVDVSDEQPAGSDGG